MHELSICNALLDQVERIASEHGANSVARIVLRIGPLAGVESELLRNAYPLAAAGTIAEQAELVIDPASVVVQCTVCRTESEVRPNRLLCSNCGDFRTQIISGDEMILQRIEFDATDPADEPNDRRREVHTGAPGAPTSNRRPGQRPGRLTGT